MKVERMLDKIVRPAFAATDDDFVDDAELVDEVEEQDAGDQTEEQPETYHHAWKCTNCHKMNEDDIEWGTRVEEVDLECSHCGCY